MHLYILHIIQNRDSLDPKNIFIIKTLSNNGWFDSGNLYTVLSLRCCQSFLCLFQRRWLTSEHPSTKYTKYCLKSFFVFFFNSFGVSIQENIWERGKEMDLKLSILALQEATLNIHTKKNVVNKYFFAWAYLQYVFFMVMFNKDYTNPLTQMVYQNG